MKQMIEKAKKLIKDKLKDHPERLIHSYGVAQTARKLAMIHHVNPDALEIAGLMHDYAKYDALNDQIKEIDPHIVTQFQDHPVIFHAYAAAHAIEEKMDCHDEAILSAVRCHVWGKPHMTTSEKILFVADFCEPSRPFEDRDYIYELACHDLNQAVLYCMKTSIDDLHQRRLEPSHASLIAYDYYKELLHDTTQ